MRRSRRVLLVALLAFAAGVAWTNVTRTPATITEAVDVLVRTDGRAAAWLLAEADDDLRAVLWMLVGELRAVR